MSFDVLNDIIYLENMTSVKSIFVMTSIGSIFVVNLLVY